MGKDKKDKKTKKPVVSDSDSSDAKPAQKRERAASNASADSKGSANKAQKKTEKAVVPQKKSNDDSSSESDFIPDPSVLYTSAKKPEPVVEVKKDKKPAPKKAVKKVVKKAETFSAESSSDENEEAKVEAKVETPAAVSNEHDGKLELYVQGLNFKTTEERLRRFFEPFGELARCELLLNVGLKSRCKAFIEYHDHEDAKAAFNDRTGQKLDGNTIRV